MRTQTALTYRLITPSSWLRILLQQVRDAARLYTLGGLAHEQERSVYYFFIFNILQLNVVIEHKLMRMWPQPHRVHFLRALVIDIGGDQLLGERVALEQELMIVLERIQRAFE